MNTKMTFTIGEHIQAMHGAWHVLAVEVCPMCKTPFAHITDTDPGSAKEAIGWAELCTDCEPDHDAFDVFYTQKHISWSEYEEMERIKNERAALDVTFGLSEESFDELICACGFEMTVEQAENLGCCEVCDQMRGSNGWPGDDMYEEEEAYVDLEKEKWDNYWGDYNQCGIRVSY